jgi:uncharacterized Ntn-hydrolase superfamily protein
MTFSLIARCARTRQFGIVVSSSSIAVPARCGRWARAHVGVVATQNITDPGLGQLGLDLLAQGCGAQSVLDQIRAATPHAAFRQLAVLDANGATAYFTGAHTLGIHAMQQGDGCLASGNMLKHAGVPKAMVDRFLASPGDTLSVRLLAALRAGVDAGGEAGPVKSAGLLVVDRFTWPVVDLRVDWHDDPVGELERIWSVYAPQMEDYIVRAVDPGSAPGYGVPGDPR